MRIVMSDWSAPVHFQVQNVPWPTTEVQKLLSNAPTAVEWFGNDVCISGDGQTLAVNNYQGNAGKGAVSIFTKVNGSWVFQQQLVDSSGSYADDFGASISLSNDGNTLVTGSRCWNASTGKAMIFTRSGSTWTLQATFMASDPAEGKSFGWSVDISADGNTAVVSAPSVGSITAGAAYIFTRSGSTWTQQTKLTPASSVIGDTFGISVSISDDGNTVVIGGGRLSTELNTHSKAIVFTRATGVWTRRTVLMPGDNPVNSNFGEFVYISGDGMTICVSARQVLSSKGAAYVFTRSVEAWSEQAKLTASDEGQYTNRFFGIPALSFDGDVLLIGAHADSDLFTDSGAAYVFTRTGTVWTEQEKLKASDASETSYFAWAVDISSDGLTGVFGSTLDSSEGVYRAGSVYMFQ